MTFWDLSLLELFNRGGFAMWPLLLCSIVAVAVIMERSLYFLRLRFNEQEFYRQLCHKLDEVTVRDAILFARSKTHPVARISECYLSHLADPQRRECALQCEGSCLLEGAEKNLKTLGTVVHLAPILGLLGTVTGLVTAFNRIEIMGGQVQPGHLAGGIWEALITTVFGLVIAIPATAFYHMFEKKADDLARRMKLAVTRLDGKYAQAVGPVGICSKEGPRQEARV